MQSRDRRRTVPRGGGAHRRLSRESFDDPDGFQASRVPCPWRTAPHGKGHLDMANIGSVNDTDFQSNVLDSTTPVLVDFWAEWCVPCHMVSPVVEEIAQEKGEALKVAKLNIDDNPQATRTYGVMSIPS